MDKEKVDAEVDKRELIREAMAVAGENPKDFEGGDKEKVREEAKLAEELAYNNSEADKHDEESDKCDEEIITDEYFNDDDKEREEVIKKLVEHADEGVKVPAIGNVRYKASAVIKKFAKANADLVPEKYKGFVDKIDSTTKDLNNELLNGMLGAITAKQDKLRQDALGSQSSGLFRRFSNI